MWLRGAALRPGGRSLGSFKQGLFLRLHLGHLNQEMSPRMRAARAEAGVRSGLRAPPWGVGGRVPLGVDAVGPQSFRERLRSSRPRHERLAKHKIDKTIVSK